MRTFPAVLIAAFLAMAHPTLLRAQESKSMPKPVLALLSEYYRDFNKAKEPSDKVLRAEATKIAAKLVSAGNADAATRIGAQVDDKIGGRRILNVDPDLSDLFSRYDGSVTTVARPIRDRYTARADALLQGPAGKDLDAVVAIGEAKKAIAGELPDLLVSPGRKSPDAGAAPQAGSTIVTTPARGKKVLSKLVEGKVWEYRLNSGTDLFGFEKDGTLKWFRSGGSRPGLTENTWVAEEDMIVVGNNSYQLRFDVSGKFGEVLFTSTKNRYRVDPSAKPMPR
jgi:hypothetical protein